MSDASFTTIIDTARKVITDPVGFYQGMAQTGGYVAPVIFVLVMAVISGIMIALMSMVGANLSAGMAIGFMAIVMMPIMALIGSFIGALIMFVIWKLMGSEKSYETAYRCVAYAAAIMPLTTLLAFIPYLGSLVKVIWSFYLMYIASIEVHAIQARTAMIVFGVLGALMLFMNLAAEQAANQMAANLESMGGQLENMGSGLEGVEDMTPAEAGKAVGEFLKGLEEAAGKQH
jgi:hypothetical protein